MAALEIQCFLNENQMSALTVFVSDRLYRSERCELEDIDICFDAMAIRLCVEFGIGLESVELKQAEILDEFWNVIDADSAVLRSRLKKIVEAYNSEENQLIDSCRDIRDEQYYKLLNY
ncbi:hypothetical protein LJC00_03860 [Dysgonomonas sp. OttesenSCG-928-M03]|nr:hypothetical protein [Dysgonomonas sp. OttesenSCG-928-M03]